MAGPDEHPRPARACDVVMKGGITSGVVYPRAVCELAKTYRLENVGGTSAGAIAAAAAAAAELGREGGAFDRLAELPHEIGRDGKLVSLFQPAPSTRPLFRLLIAAVEHKEARGKAQALVGELLKQFPGPALLGSLPGLVLLVVAVVVAADSALAAVALAVAGLVFLLAGAIGAAAYGATAVARTAIPANHFGLCSGMTVEPEPGPDSAGAKEGLTPWLDRLIDGLAGRDGDGPLTFGHLWAGPGGDPDAADPDHPWMRLEMVTTNVTNRRAERLPWAAADFYFDSDELGRLFPEHIVTWLTEHPPPLPADGAARDKAQLERGLLWPLRPLPHAADLPVVVATRMSLSFPVLLSAVPLWRVDWSRKANADARKGWRRWIADEPAAWETIRDDPDRVRPAGPTLPAPAAERCWFSDGGISSNFPVHFFDAFVPRHPTFAINLRPFHPDHPKSKVQAENVWMADSNRGGISDWWYRFDADLAGFLGNIVRTMQNRVDEAQMRLPGYRDRVVHVSLDEREGGMNLTMEEATIDELTERGELAAARLVERFAEQPPADAALTWPNHRWVRYRSSLAALATMLREFARGYGDVGAPTYPELLARGSDDPPNSYRVTGPQRELARELSDGMVALAARLEAADAATRLDAGAPSPPVVARLTPMDPPLRRKGA